jgi:hypothetical protein
MKKIFFLLFIVFLTTFTLQVNAQKAPKQKADTTKPCKPTKSGKHCARPSNG